MSRRRLPAGLAFSLALVVCGLLRPAQAAPANLFFPETGQSISAEIMHFWQSTPDAVRILGYPISTPFIQASSTEPRTFLRVQYFERAVLEEHPQPDRRILIQGRLLGNELIVARRAEPPFAPLARPGLVGAWDPYTRHMIADTPAPFGRFYQQFGGLRVFGRPTSEQFQEFNRDTGRFHWVQYFERQRMEWHPEEADPAYQVMLGRLGAEYRLAHAADLDDANFAYRSGPRLPSERLRYGVNASLFYTDQDRALGLARSAGLGWIRQQVHWKDHQGPDRVIAWGQLDQIVAAADVQGLKLFLSVIQAPDWATGMPGIAGLPDRAHFADYAAFMGALAARYRGRVQAYQVWNEINLPAENGVQAIPDAAYYVDLLAAAHTAIKDADPDALVISTSLAPSESTDRQVAVGDLQLFRELFANPRFWSHVDAVGVHVFGCANPPDTIWPERPGAGPGWNTSREFYFRRVEDVRRAMVESGHGERQIWITEFGWATANNTPGHEFGNQVSQAQQATYLVRAFEIGRYDYAPWLGAMFVWNLNFAVGWRDAGNPLHQMAAYGILNSDWSPRPAYTAIQNMPKP